MADLISICVYCLGDLPGSVVSVSHAASVCRWGIIPNRDIPPNIGHNRLFK